MSSNSHASILEGAGSRMTSCSASSERRASISRGMTWPLPSWRQRFSALATAALSATPQTTPRNSAPVPCLQILVPTRSRPPPRVRPGDLLGSSRTPSLYPPQRLARRRRAGDLTGELARTQAAIAPLLIHASRAAAHCIPAERSAQAKRPPILPHPLLGTTAQLPILQSSCHTRPEGLPPTVLGPL